jgi:hypothetical protein
MKKLKEKATEHIQLKLTPTEYEPFKKLLGVTNLKQATLFRKIVLGNDINVVQVEGKSAERKRAVFFANKASNNINQIAKNLNQAYRGGVINEHLYIQTLNKLITLEKLFSGAIDKC